MSGLSHTEKISDYTIPQLCRHLEWCHRNAKNCLKEDHVDLGNDRAALDELAYLKNFEKEIVIKTIRKGWQEWFTVYYKDTILFSCYLDNEAFCWNSEFHKSAWYDACVRELCDNSKQ